MNNVKPIPCPFCGSEEIELIKVYGGEMVAHMFSYICKSCGTQGLIKGKKDIALKCWNSKRFVYFKRYDDD